MRKTQAKSKTNGMDDFYIMDLVVSDVHDGLHVPFTYLLLTSFRDRPSSSSNRFWMKRA